jgi:nitrite reductase/ring-hydroxylating ferredoxin subunit
MQAMETRSMTVPPQLVAVGIQGEPFTAVMRVDEIGDARMRRFTRGDDDYLVVSTDEGLVVIDDRCPHMAAPLSLGTLEDCVVGCPLHKGKFDLATGGAVQFPTTGGLDADGGYHAPWTPAGAPQKPEPTDLKAQARALTRVRRLRYYPVRVVDGVIEVQLPPT